MLGAIMRTFAVFRFKNLASLFPSGRSSFGAKGYPVQKGHAYETIEVNSVEHLTMLWQRFDFESQLHVLAQMVERFGAETLFRAADPAGKTVCHWIAYKGTRPALKYVLDCDPSIINVWHLDRTNPLIHLAFMGNNIDMVDALLELGLDLNVTNEYGQNAMTKVILAVYNLGNDVKTYDIVLRCFIYGIDVNSANVDTKQTPLHYAVQRFYEQDVHLLLRLGANPEATDNWGRSPYDCAVRNGNHKMAALLAPDKAAALAERRGTKDKVGSYWTMLRENAMVRGRELMMLGGTAFSVFHLTVLSMYLLPVYFWYYIGHTWNLWPVHLLLISCLVLMAFTGLLTVFSMANFMPTRSSEYIQLMSYLRNPAESASKRCRTLDQFQATENARLCHICECIALEHSKHCYFCNRCCLDYDHHCVFLRTCIGAGNIKLFTAFAFLLGACGVLGLVVVGYSLTLDLAVLAPTLKQHGFLYKLWKGLSFFSLFNIVICAQFMAVGIGMASTTYFKRRQTLAYRKEASRLTPLTSIKLI